jgi:hypothetical protein
MPIRVEVDAPDLAILLSAALTIVLREPGDSPSREYLAQACRHVSDALNMTPDHRQALLRAVGTAGTGSA